MASDENHKDAEKLMAQAAIVVPEARLGALSFAIVGTLAQLKALSAYDYGLTEPASRFRAPR